MSVDRDDQGGRWQAIYTNVLLDKGSVFTDHDVPSSAYEKVVDYTVAEYPRQSVGM
jgi:hypothetical protein